MSGALLVCCFIGLCAAAGSPGSSHPRIGNIHGNQRYNRDNRSQDTIQANLYSTNNNNQELPPSTTTTKVPEYAFVLGTIGKAIRVANSSNGLALELFKRVADHDNVFFAPFAISTVLSMAYQGSAGRTAEEMAKVLGYEHSKDLKQFLLDGFKSARSLVNEETGTNELIDVNTMLIDSKIKILPEIKGKLENYYGVSVQEVNFQRSATLKVLDTLVTLKTKGHIKNAFGDHEVLPNTIMILANVIFFKGVWAKQFDPKNTIKGIFLNEGQKAYAKEVDFMTMLDYYQYAYYPKLKLSALDVPYTGYQMRMTILLPDDPSRMGSILDNINTDDVRQIVLEMEPALVEVILPLFKISSRLNLKEYLQKLGMRSGFNQGIAELPYFTADDSLHINEFVHQAVIEVNEQGTLAAASTAAAHATRSRVVKFHATSPFLFIIRDSRTGLFLFVGKVSKL
ncbi:leukocyte elastase inhibitor-like [Varroa jacobsoni]|uniref:leukocyte elastase inhibitor-like n=1 Tax=Varroa jacobsoni TaxID=62625 RepID=UPI000BF9A328|nr:leukocyte elastase inhibitor-like [Varroa jacobsoni]XP_022686331.1 leukocyte elastase inhibitor-like [Varroa jacobsoni]XP_022686332.1 leukocyte elastase inhibitor-like [Varroa jacobsoni]XP_022686333.1 leukocyte elastase inhibitor-like [Varroa jacobsoni]XP_022686334.1 leukocyte elastase inhibitor-like [Varroa jacobsoni]